MFSFAVSSSAILRERQLIPERGLLYDFYANPTTNYFIQFIFFFWKYSKYLTLKVTDYSSDQVCSSHLSVSIHLPENLAADLNFGS